MPQDANAAERKFWSDAAGPKWVQFQLELDALHCRVAEHLIAVASPDPADRVIDIGCGSGETTRMLAARAPGGRVTGVDISPILLDRARLTGGDGVDYLLADAQTHDLASYQADVVTSRFGVMFFDDPVAAFSNILRALRPGGRLAMICWRSMAENPWFRLPIEAAQKRLGPVTPADPHAPGPMAFSDPARVLGILEAAGWMEPTSTPVSISLPVNGGANKAADLATNIGPVTRFMAEKNGGPKDIAAIRDALAVTFEAFDGSAGFAVPASFNVFQARASTQP